MPINIITKDGRPHKYFMLAAFAFLLINLFLIGYQMSLWDDDEAAYAGFALRMIETGDWVNPDYFWSDVHRKTPFHFWTIAISYLIFGVNEFAVRVPAALAVVITVLAVWKWGAALFGKAQSEWAAIILSSSFLVLAMGKMSLTDAWLMCFETLAVLALFNYLKAPNWRWNLVFWLAIAIGTLVKGPPILILCGGLWLGLAILHPERKRLIGTHPWFFGLLALLPFCAWAYCSYQSDGGALLTFLYEWYVVRRIGGVVFGQTGPAGYHLVVAIVAFLPWLPFFLIGLWRSFRFGRKDNENIQLLLWMVFGWIFYELMSSKLPSYAMGAHPAFAIAAAKVLVSYLNEEAPHKIKKWVWIVLPSIWMAFSISFCVVLPIFFGNSSLLYIGLVFMLVPAIVFFFVNNGARPIMMALWGGLCFALIWGIGGYVLDHSPAKSASAYAAKMEEISLSATVQYQKTALVGFSARQLRMSFPFYIERKFDKPLEWTVAQALEALKKEEKLMLLVGEEAITPIKKAMEMDSISYKNCQYDETLKWQSLNDQLKYHPLIIVWN